MCCIYVVGLNHYLLNNFSVLNFCIYGCTVVLNILPLFNAILPLSSSFLRQSEPYVVNLNFQICEFASCLRWLVTVSIWRGHCVYSREWNEDFQWLVSEESCTLQSSPWVPSLGSIISVRTRLCDSQCSDIGLLLQLRERPDNQNCVDFEL